MVELYSWEAIEVKIMTSESVACKEGYARETKAENGYEIACRRAP